MSFLPDREQVVLRYILERHAKEQPQKECMIFEDGEQWTYAELFQQGCIASHALSKAGIKRGDHVLIFLPNGQGYLRAWLGVSFLGAVIVPVNTAFKGESLKHICRDSEARTIITEQNFAERLTGLELDLRVIDPENLADAPAKAPIPEQPIEPWDIHAIIYTSGTTGASKGVIQPYLQTYTHSFEAYVRKREAYEDMVWVAVPLFHISGISLCYGFWTKGSKVVLQSKFSATQFLDFARAHGITFAPMVTAMAEFILSVPPKPDDADNPVRTVAVTGIKEPAAFMKRFGITDLYYPYSMTEISTPISSYTPHQVPKGCGKARPGVEVRLVDDHDIPVRAGQAGELIVRSDLPWEMNAGYWKRPETTARAWRNGWFHTGDFMRCDEEGNYYFIDRKKDCLRRRGENISSFEVEREVLAYPDILEAVCIGVPSEFGEDEVKVFVVIREGADFDPANLIGFLIPRMPYYMIPRFIEVIDEFPRTPTLRVKKYELRAWGNSPATWDREKAGIAVPKC